MPDPVLLAAAWALEVALGWPASLYRRLRHPVVWFGTFVDVAERRLNRDTLSARQRRFAGAAFSLGSVVLVAALAFTLQDWLAGRIAGQLLLVILASSLLASRSLHEHVAAVARALDKADTPGARDAVSCLVGRDPAQLDEPAIARAALESLAENTSDGVVAPLFWGLLFGLPGLAAYKAVNTLDSMIAYRNERFEDFGAFAARLDDLANLLPARITAWAFIAAGGKRGAIAILRRDARSHRSPNAGWPEAAMAGVLGVRLGGPRIYHGKPAPEPWLHGEAPDPDPGTIHRGLALYRRALGLLALLILGVAAAVLIHGR